MSLTLERKTLAPAIIGAGICLVLHRAGILSLFYLVPLGFLTFRFGSKTAWTALFFAVLANLLLSMLILGVQGLPIWHGITDLVFFTVMAVIFIWILSPPPSLLFNLGGSLRMILGSSMGALFFVFLYLRLMTSQAFLDQITSITGVLISLQSSGGADVVENALIESINIEFIIETMKSIMLRGGALITCILIFFGSRQAGLVIARLSRRERGTPVFIRFRVLPVFIWVLSVSLLLLVLTKVAGLETPEIILWNVLILCVMMYLAQGFGILQFLLARPSISPFFRLLLLAGFFILLFSPVLNTILFAGIVLLGIAENWVPFRIPKTNGSPSTPEA